MKLHMVGNPSHNYSQPRISRTFWAAKKSSTYPNFDLSDIKKRRIKTIGTIEKSLTYPKIRLIRISTYPRLTVLEFLFR